MDFNCKINCGSYIISCLKFKTKVFQYSLVKIYLFVKLTFFVLSSLHKKILLKCLKKTKRIVTSEITCLDKHLKLFVTLCKEK